MRSTVFVCGEILNVNVCDCISIGESVVHVHMMQQVAIIKN